MQSVPEQPIDLTGPIANSDALFDEYHNSHVTSTYRFRATCRMTSRGKGGVVDQSGRVYKVRGLRVCDASILSTVPASNTMRATTTVAERIGASIRDGRDLAAVERPRL
jgi:choline dehydrogenase-like flavoprotein